jgi:phosphinothricin acetyltransferase
MRKEYGMSAVIRLATAHDAEQIQAIYAPIVRDTAISFELVPPTVDEMRQRITKTLEHLPWIVCVHREEVLGYAYASAHRSRAAYQWAVDVSVYIHAATRRSGVGRAIYTSLFTLLTLQGFFNVYAGITLPNPGSVGLHEAMGFRPVGVYRAVGYKLGAWHDVGWWQRTLQNHTLSPAPPTDLQHIRTAETWETALTAGLTCLRL